MPEVHIYVVLGPKIGHPKDSLDCAITLRPDGGAPQTVHKITDRDEFETMASILPEAQSVLDDASNLRTNRNMVHRLSLSPEREQGEANRTIEVNDQVLRLLADFVAEQRELQRTS